MTTQPRIALDDLTSDALDALYDERDRLAADLAQREEQAVRAVISVILDPDDTPMRDLVHEATARQPTEPPA